MKISILKGVFKTTVLLMVILGLSTCSGSKKATSTSNMFKIPKKIVSVDDLPADLKSGDQSPVHYIQLYPDEEVQSDETVAEQNRSNELMETKTVPAATSIPAGTKSEPAVIVEEKPDIEKYVDKIVDDVTHNRTKPIFYHIVSGSFQNKVYAGLFAEHLKSIGYGNTYIRFFDNGFNRVIVQRYNNEVEARQYLQGYRIENPKYADAWLYYNLNSSDDPMAYIIR